jgi:hypothetical protein
MAGTNPGRTAGDAIRKVGSKEVCLRARKSFDDQPSNVTVRKYGKPIKTFSCNGNGTVVVYTRSYVCLSKVLTNSDHQLRVSRAQKALIDQAAQTLGNRLNSCWCGIA